MAVDWPIMIAFRGPLFFFLVTGSYLFFWPVYRVFHSRRTRRRQALFRLFLLELVVYILLTVSVNFAFFWIPDFHHFGLLLAELAYLSLLVIFWVATYGVWADNSPNELEP